MIAVELTKLVECCRKEQRFAGWTGCRLRGALVGWSFAKSQNGESCQPNYFQNCGLVCAKRAG
jgi:hypothetical protein